MREILLSFIFVFLAALPGRTTLILILLSASVKAWRIFVGSIPAFLLQCAIAVLAGSALSGIPQKYSHVAAGILFIYFAVKFWMEARKNDTSEENHSEKSVPAIFLLFFLAEFGDVSQLAVVSQASQSQNIWNVFIGAAAAMSTIVMISVFLGRIISKKFDHVKLQKIAALIFLLIGIYLLSAGIQAFINGS